MSFSSEVKDEMCRVDVHRKCCALAECYGAFLYGNTFTSGEIKIITENRAFAERLPKLMKKAFGFEPDMLPDEKKGGKLIISVTDSEKNEAILQAFGYSWDTNVSHHINLAMLEDECCKVAFLRGVFLAGGSVTDPEKRYHLELVTNHRSVSGELYSLLLEMGFEPKETERAGSRITYFKQSNYIEDILTLIGAPVSSMKIMNAKLEKELINDVNRRVNCETANINKTVSAAMKQVNDIRYIRDTIGLKELPEGLREIAELRLEYPNETLKELGDLLSTPLGKSGVNHRLRKLSEMAEHLKEHREEQQL